MAGPMGGKHGYVRLLRSLWHYLCCRVSMIAATFDSTRPLWETTGDRGSIGLNELDAMETSLHRQLKEQFREPGSQIEVKLGPYRIDVVNGTRLVEIQQSSLSAIRDKVGKLVRDHQVDVVKPLVVRKRLIKLARKNGRETSRRWSPKTGSILDLFEELMYFTRVFPHPNLRLIVPLVEIEELRYPGHGRRRRWRRNDFVVEDRRLIKTTGMEVFHNGSCLHRLLPELPETFDTSHLASGLSIRRHEAQRIAWVMHKSGCAERIGKKGNAFLYRLTDDSLDSKRGKVEKETSGKKPVKKKPDMNNPEKNKPAKKKRVKKKQDKKNASKKKTAVAKSVKKKPTRKSANRKTTVKRSPQERALSKRAA